MDKVVNFSSIFFLTLFLLFGQWSCANQNAELDRTAIGSITPGAYHIDSYKEKLIGKRVGLIVNQSSTIEETHLLDTLLALGVDIRGIFTPEHGFKGNLDAGEKVDGEKARGVDLPIHSLYGKNRKPGSHEMSELDVMVFDIQDVGVRFYTYISTLHYVMEACAEHDVELVVLDRPNPNAHYVDGPILDTAYTSFIGMHEVPVVYGMTIGEYGLMINGEGWLGKGLKCRMNVVECRDYDHTMEYELPISPSPNLPNPRSILLYPSLCFFEGTVVSVGRGTNFPFQTYGHPELHGSFHFKPVPNYGAKHPKLEDEDCMGYDLRTINKKVLRLEKQLNLSYLINAFAELENKREFFNRPDFFDKLVGSSQLRDQILRGHSEEMIRESWKEDLAAFNTIRLKYLLY